jgi:heat shock protein HslJ
MVRPIGSAACIALLAGCASAGGGSPPPAWPDSRWRADVIMDVKGARMVVPDDVVVDLAFDAAATRAAGSAGCNRYNTTASVDGARLSFGPAVASKRLCPGAVMAVESAFLAALPRVANARTDGDRLLLSDAEGAPLLELVAATE